MTTEPTAAELLERISTLLRRVAVETRQCRYCRRDIAMVKHTLSGKFAVYDMDGLSHYVTCPAADQARADRQARINTDPQPPLFYPD